jgi:hypothetical protein
MAANTPIEAVLVSKLDPSKFAEGGNVVEMSSAKIARAADAASAAMAGVERAVEKAGGTLDRNRDGFDRYFASIDKNVAAAQAYQRDLDKLNRYQEAGVLKTGEYATALSILKSRYEDVSVSQRAVQTTMLAFNDLAPRIDQRFRDLGKSAKESADAFQDARQEFDQFWGSIDQNVGRAQQMQREIDKLNQFHRQGVTTNAEYSVALATIKSNYADLGVAQEKASSGLGAFTSMIGFARNALGALGIALSVASVAQWGMAVESTAASLAEQAQQVGVTTTALQAYRGVMEITGGRAEQMDRILARLTDRLGEAREKAGTARDAFLAMGLSANDLGGDASAALPKLAQSALKYSDQQKAVNDLNDVFGEKLGRFLIPGLSDYAKGYDDVAAKAKAAGLVIEDDFLKRADDAADKMHTAAEKMRVAWTPFFVWIAEKLASLGDQIQAAMAAANDPKLAAGLGIPTSSGDPWIDAQSNANAQRARAGNNALALIFGTNPAAEAAKGEAIAKAAADKWVSTAQLAAEKVAKAAKEAADKAQAAFEQSYRVGVQEASHKAVEAANTSLGEVSKRFDKMSDEIEKRAQATRDHLAEQATGGAKSFMDSFDDVRKHAKEVFDDMSGMVQGFWDAFLNGGSVLDYFKRQLTGGLSSLMTQMTMGQFGGAGGVPGIGGGIGQLLGMGGGLGGMTGGGGLLGAAGMFGASSLPSWLGGFGSAGAALNATPLAANGMINGISVTPQVFGSGTGGILGSLGGLGSLLGAGGMGAGIGSIWSGLGLGKSTGSTIGGTIGGIAGSIIPGVGTILGSLAGSAIGGLFGNSKPSDYTGFANFGPGYTLSSVSGDKPNQTTLAAAQQAGDAVAKIAKLLNDAGITLQDDVVRLRIGQERASQLELANHQFVTIGGVGDVQGASSGAIDYLLGGAKSDDTKTQALLDKYRGEGNLNSSTIDALIKEANEIAQLPSQAAAFNKALQAALDQIKDPDAAAYNAMMEEQAARIEIRRRSSAPILISSWR